MSEGLDGINSIIIVIPLNIEILEIIQSMHSIRAQGHDGMPTSFY